MIVWFERKREESSALEVVGSNSAKSSLQVVLNSMSEMIDPAQAVSSAKPRRASRYKVDITHLARIL